MQSQQVGFERKKRELIFAGWEREETTFDIALPPVMNVNIWYHGSINTSLKIMQTIKKKDGGREAEN